MATVLERITPRTAKKPEAGTVHWFSEHIERGKGDPHAEVVTLTPGLAKIILANNPDNRNIRPVKVRHFARDMAAGRWPLNGETIILADTGELNDGQHRLEAVIEANITVPATVFFGARRETRTTVDQGSARGAAAYLRMQGTPYAEVASKVARSVLGYEESNGRNLYLGNACTPAEVMERATRDGGIGEAIDATAPYIHRAKPLKVPHSAFAFAYYVCAKEDEADAGEFFEKVATGENLKSGQAAFTAREKFLNNRYTYDEKVELLLRAWNFFRRGKPVSPSNLQCLKNLPALI